MSLKGCPACVKYLVFSFNFIIWLIGLILLGFGVWAIADPNISSNWDGANGSKVFGVLDAGSYVVIGLGAIIMLTGFCGCCGAIRESQCCLAMFFFVLLLIFIGLISTALFILIGISNDDIGKILQNDILKESILDQGIQSYRDCEQEDDTSSCSTEQNVLKLVEKAFNCCGSKSYRDYDDISLPALKPNCTHSDIIHQKYTNKKIDPEHDGCTEVVWEKVKQHGVLIGGVLVGVACLVLLAMIFACVLCCAIRRNGYFDDEF